MAMKFEVLRTAGTAHGIIFLAKLYRPPQEPSAGARRGPRLLLK